MKVVYSIKVKVKNYQTWSHHIYAIIPIFDGATISQWLHI